MLPRLAKHYGGQISRVFFDEGGALDGEASYSTPYFSRPGRWGVFHLARFAAGPAEEQRSGTGSAAPPRIRPPTVHARPSRPQPGFCSFTDDALGVGDCAHGDKGTVKLQDPEFGLITSVETCANWCVQFCARCRYVSFSLAANDCSWYNECDLERLNQQFRNLEHVSREVALANVEGGVEEGGGAVAGARRNEHKGASHTGRGSRGGRGRGRARRWGLGRRT